MSNSTPIKGIVQFGSAKLREGTETYKQVYDFMFKLCKRYPNLPVITGGGSGTMEAANKAAQDAGNYSVGYPIVHFQESEPTNMYMDECVMCDTFAHRKRHIMFQGVCYLLFPGGIGTLDELFEIMCLMQVGEVEEAPIYLVDKEFWGFMESIKNATLGLGTTVPEQFGLLRFIDFCDEIALDKQ